MRIHAPKIGVWRISTPIWVAVSTGPQEGSSLRAKTSYDVYIIKIRPWMQVGRDKQ